MKHPLRSLCLVALALLPLTAPAFPPAPHHLIYGMVKDEYGTPIMNPQAKVLLLTSNSVAVSTTVVPGLAVGINYALEVPMDAALMPGLYRTNAQRSGALYRLYVVIGSVTNTPIEMTGAYKVLAKPAEQTHWDLTLGQDLNGNGIPDEWEYAFLAALGLDLDFATLRANVDYTGNRRTLMDEYRLGNYPFNPEDQFTVRIVTLNEGAPLLEFTTMSGRSYAVQGSADLKQWTPLTFTIPALSTSKVRSDYTAPDIRTLQLQVVPSGAAANLRFFRLGLQ